MTASYHFFVSRYPIDSVLLALKAGRASHNLIVAPSASGETKRYFQLPEGLPLEWVLGGQPSEIPRVSFAGRSFSFLLGCSNPAGGLLPRLRTALVDFSPVSICLTYDKIGEDLPILLPDDNVSLFWHTPDLLTNRQLKELEELEEQLKAGEPGFSGLHFYHRGQAEESHRLQDLIKKARLPKEEATRIEGGHKWLKVCS